MATDFISKSALLNDIYNRPDKPQFYDGQDVADWMEKCIKEAPIVSIDEILDKVFSDDGK